MNTGCNNAVCNDLVSNLDAVIVDLITNFQWGHDKRINSLANK